MSATNDESAASAEQITLGGVRAQAGGRRACSVMTGGFRGIPRVSSGTPVLRCRRPPAGLLEGIGDAAVPQ